jgi:predicted ribosomally synthesized peptide with nif11-like leader
LLLFYDITQKRKGNLIMSQAIATQFIQKVSQNESLRAEVIGLGTDMAALVKLAAREGFIVSEADLQAAGAAATSAGQPLSEDQLMAVAGGHDGMTPGSSRTNNRDWTGCGSGINGCHYAG